MRAIGDSVQHSAPRASIEIRPILATMAGVPAAVIVLTAAGGRASPVLGSDRAGLIGLWLLGSVMCSWGIGAMRDRFGVRGVLAGLPFGLLNTALLLSAVFGWRALLQPIATALGSPGEPASLDRAAIVGVGALMLVKWAIAWLALLPASVRHPARGGQ